jgi:basic membrane lipoprotein Med (substrate-binding protein (PBP1-ABC) superfamily)
MRSEPKEQEWTARVSRGSFVKSVLASGATLGFASSPAAVLAARQSSSPRLIVGALHVGSIKDAGYNQAEHDGLVKMMANVPGIQLLEAENVPEAPDAVRVMTDMIQQGATLVFPQSFGYQDFALQVAAQHPNVKFEHPAGYKLARNFGTYWAASHQLSYLLGMAAGKVTSANKLGFVGGFPIPQILATIGAWHLGARSVNPHVTTRVVFIGAWSDPGKETTATNALADQGSDVVTMVVDSPISVVQTAEQRGIHSIGYHSAAVARFAPTGWINGIDFQWGSLFTSFAQEVIAHTWKSQAINADLASGTVALAGWGNNVPAATRQIVAAKEKQFLTGDAHVWVGPIYDQHGKLRVKGMELATTQAEASFINTCNWLPEGVIGSTS